MHGYGHWQNRARAQETPLFARALFIQDEAGRNLIFCCLDLGYITHAMRSTASAQLRGHLGARFNEASFILTCTHTHSGPGGCAHEALYNLVTPGFQPEHLARVVEATVGAVLQAVAGLQGCTLGLSQGGFAPDIPLAWNRSLAAYNRNPDVVPRTHSETHLALDRSMQVLSLRRAGQVQALLSLFGVHATCVGNSQTRHCGDNKGYAALQAEALLTEAGHKDAVAIFAQATAGDVSPHYQGPGDIQRRRQIQGDAEFRYAERNGRYQSERALELAQTPAAQNISGPIDAVLSYIDFSDQQADPRFANGEPAAYTSEPCHGVAFFVGTRVDGPGMPKALGLLAGGMAQGLKARRLKKLAVMSTEDRAYYQRLYAAQGPKAILLESGRKEILGQALDKLMLPGFADPLVGELKRQASRGALKESPLVPTVLPLQIVTLGNIALLCCPGEFTTTAGQRLLHTVKAVLARRGIEQVLICTYCNDYMGYVTTQEEYQEQAYEGGHTIFGQWTLAAFQTRFEKLAEELLKPEAQRQHDRRTRPQPVPEAELALRSRLAVPV